MKNNGYRALVVDDDHAWQSILQELLEDNGFIVDLAGNPESAVEWIQNQPHRLAVVDLSLENNDPHNQAGLILLEHIQKHDPGCLTILLSGYTTVEVAVNALKEYGAFTCLQKETFQRKAFQEIIQQMKSAPPFQPNRRNKNQSSLFETREEAITHPESVPDYVLVVDDDAGWRSILSELVSDAGYRVRACSNFSEAYGGLSQGTYKLIILDLLLSGTSGWGKERSEVDLEGKRLIEAAGQKGMLTIVVSGMGSPEDIEAMLSEENLFSYIEKQSFDRQKFMSILQDAHRHIENWERSLPEVSSLTSRERELLDLVSRGYTNQQIADQLTISVNTVKRHLKAVFRKLNIHNRAAAIAIHSTKGSR